MTNEFIAVNSPLLTGNEKKYLMDCIDSGWISSEGSYVTKLEQSMAQLTQRQHGIAVCNGTVALELAVKAIGIEPGDEVIMPTFTIISCALAIVRAGGIPVLVDSCSDTWNMDIKQIESKITEKTKAIMVVHIYGLPVEMNPVIELAEKYNLKIIEDAAQMLGQCYYERPCGSFGDVSIFSFYPNKLVTTGEGGMVVTNSLTVAQQCQLLRNLSFIPEQRYYHEQLGYNFRMSNLQAAVGVAQFERLNDYIQIKHEMGERYQTLLKDLDTLQLPIAKTDYAQNIYWVFGMVSKREDMPASKWMKALRQQGIDSRAFFVPMHQQPVFQKMGLFQNESYPVAEKLGKYGFYIPSGLALTTKQIEKVCQTIKNLVSASEIVS